MYKILEALAELRAYGSASLAEVLSAESARFGRNCTLVVITPSLDERWVTGCSTCFTGACASLQF